MGKKKLLVEGKNDIIVVSTLCESHDIWPENEHRSFNARSKTPAFQCKDKKSVEQLLAHLDVELAESDLEVMGIIVDADANLVARWHSLSHRLQQCGYAALPSTPDPGGTIIQAKNCQL